MTKVIAALFIALSLCGCKESKEENKTMVFQNQAIKSHCVGRVVLSLPVSFVQSSVSTGSFNFVDAKLEDPAVDVIVRGDGLTEKDFNFLIQKRRQEIKALDDGSTNVLKVDKDLGGAAHLFRVNDIEDAYTSEVNVFRGGDLITLRLESYRNGFLEAEERLAKFVSEIQEIAPGPNSGHLEGFCFGSLLLTGRYRDENASFLFRDGKGNSFDIDVDTYRHDEKTPLLNRMSGPDSLLTVFKVDHSVLRKGERTIASMHAQEWLGSARVREDAKTKMLQFAAETMRQTPGKQAPSLSISFNTAQPLEDGSQTETILSHAEAMALWDQTLDSVRLASVMQK